MAQSSANPAAEPAPPTGGGPSADGPSGPTGPATTPQFTLTGPRAPNNCVTAGTDPLQWVLNVTDSGPSPLRFVALAHHDEKPGCDATTKHPRTRVELSGTTSYKAHSSGQTIMTFDPKMYNCGRVQVDVSIFDDLGNEILIVAIVLNYGSECTPPSGGLVCTPPSQASPTGPPASFGFSAAGGNGAYSWSAPSASPASGSGTSFSTSYATAGTFVVTVTSGSQTATCTVTIPPPISTPQCLPLSQTVAINQPATLFGTGGSSYA
ncbi:MAG: PKD domain-containing protein, partial [Vicinamibacterales bacterium]